MHATLNDRNLQVPDRKERQTLSRNERKEKRRIPWWGERIRTERKQLRLDESERVLFCEGGRTDSKYQKWRASKLKEPFLESAESGKQNHVRKTIGLPNNGRHFLDRGILRALCTNRIGIVLCLDLY
ncbi:uncharacterized protein LAJ45_00048 [Morchella importuna]|uniref:uncharacterized protein n=1 Tax=Morchella importuna TaxID=1174673 RepID=UPI001E8D3F2E|nr:uncharacterized protein LAJ45_00048 [Morchella importuna]KAH8155040.1 hypothetical protein LAJ45_00048 [Morchella importuna]